MPADARRRIGTFLGLTFTFCTPLYALIISAGTLDAAGGLYVVALMWSPGLAALLTRFIFQRNLRGGGWGPGKARYLAAGYLLPLGACLIVYGLVWSTGLGGVSSEALTGERGGLLQRVLLAGTGGVLLSSLFAAGEEIGWRGLLVPDLARNNGFTRTSLITGAIWSVYHYPLLLFADYHSGAPRGYGLLMFTAMVLMFSFIATWLRLRSGSVWPAVLIHASHNLWVQSVFDRLTVPQGVTEYVTTEFGVGLVLAYAGAALWCWWRRAGGRSAGPWVRMTRGSRETHS